MTRIFPGLCSRAHTNGIKVFVSVSLLLILVVARRAPAFAVSIDTVLPFAGEDNVRIQTTLTSEAALPGVELSGRIAPFPNGNTLWEGALGTLDLKRGIVAQTGRSVTNLKPKRWQPTSPALYNLTVTAKQKGRTLAARTVRFGFRSFASEGGRFYLNGRPIFLRGIAINPPGRTVPPAAGESRAFAEAYVRYLKSQNVNTFRLTHDSDVWFDVCDELGMLVYQGRYGAPPGATTKAPPADPGQAVADYQKLFSPYVRHPCIVIYILSNEMPYTGSRGASFQTFLSQAHERLRRWDSTRLYIGNAGYGEGRSGDVRDVHRYWGWYYNTFLTYQNLRDTTLFGDPKTVQPWTFTECVGNFTGPLGEYNIVPRKQLAPQLGWTGHSPNQREDALGYQSFMVQQATESFRRLRPLNPYLSGIMPFTILFYHWSGITSFDQMKPKPAMEQMGVSYQPVLLSWELWTPQVYAGSTVRAIAHVVNDADDGGDLAGATLLYQVQDKAGRAVHGGKIALPRVAYYGAWSAPVPLPLPPDLATGDYVLSGKVVQGDRQISHNRVGLFVAGADWKKTRRPPGQPLFLYDPPGKTAAVLTRLGVSFQTIADAGKLPPGAAALLIGEDAWDGPLAASSETLRRFVRAGGRVLCLGQDPATFDAGWLPAKIEFFTASANDPAYLPKSRPSRDGMNVNPERPGHPVFDGLSRYRLALWSDYTGWDQARAGFPRVYPVTRGFKLAGPESLARTAILANYDRGLEGVALGEFFDGAGSVLLSGFDLVPRSGSDPAADRLLRNLVAYAASEDGHHVHPLVDKPIRWGNYPSEQGVITGPINGLIVHAEWVVPPTNPGATPLSEEEGAWNTRPGDQFVPAGRRPFGPFGYSTAAGVRDLDPTSRTGSGIFWARIPAGKKTVVTRVKNPTKQAGTLAVEINGKRVAGPAGIPGGKIVRLESNLPAGTTELTDLSVRYTGDKGLVLLETAFE